jgi:hypothetical protein
LATFSRSIFGTRLLLTSVTYFENGGDLICFRKVPVSPRAYAVPLTGGGSVRSVFNHGRDRRPLLFGPPRIGATIPARHQVRLHQAVCLHWPNLIVEVSSSQSAEKAAMRAFEVFAIYVTPFLIIGLAIKFLMTRYGVSLSEVEKQAGPKPKRRFLLGAWRTDE